MFLWIIDLFEHTGLGKILDRLLNYSTVRAGLCFGMSLILGLFAGPMVIAWLRNRKIAQIIKKMKSTTSIDLSEMHKSKAGTPTMGGILIFGSTLIPVLLFAKLANSLLLMVLFVMVFSFLLGIADDLIKLKARPGWGLTAKAKLISQILIALVLAVLLYYYPSSRAYQTSIIIPFLKDTTISLHPILYTMWIVLVIVGSINAVNLTDGLDGLATGVCFTVESGLMIMTYIIGRTDWSQYLYLPHVYGSGELFVLLAALIGATLAFLWFNCHPAEVFMGDCGALMLGGTLGTIAVLLHIELFFAVFSLILVAEGLSVILQVGSFKFFRKRIFRMAPLHHHFEKCGWNETKIVIRFWIMSLLFIIVGLGLLKLR